MAPATADANVPERFRDFMRNPTYERMLVAFYDILGWRAEMEDAGTDAKRIGNLRRLILQHSRMLRLPVEAPVLMTASMVFCCEEGSRSGIYFTTKKLCLARG